MKKLLTLILIGSLSLSCAFSQQNEENEALKGDLEELKQQILRLELEQENVTLNINQYRKRFNLGLIMATIGYTTVVAGGQLLGGENDQLGSNMLYIGGALGIAGTVIVIDSGKFLKRASSPPQKSP